MNKKGELTTTQIVTMIVLIASFVIILILIFRLNLGEETDKEICRNSVVLKGQSKLTSGPLDCKTQYVCISGGDDCMDFTATERIDVDAEDINETLKALADEMASCWYTFGEGKINYGDKALVERRVEYAICSIISFDEKIQSQISEISYNEFYDYLRTANKSQSQTYLQYLYGISDVGFFTPEEQVKIYMSQDKISTSQEYSIITGIDNNPTPIDDVILKVYIVPTGEINLRLVSNRDFVTKAQ